jgi:hypothetical protein
VDVAGVAMVGASVGATVTDVAGVAVVGASVGATVTDPVATRFKTFEIRNKEQRRVYGLVCRQYGVCMLRQRVVGNMVCAVTTVVCWDTRHCASI